jgi:tRNA pseudouridine32 synthase/23S rRNA pseudouridine746 synthase
MLLTQPISSEDNFFTPFPKSVDVSNLPERFTFPFDYKPHPLCIAASEELQQYLENTQWEHNFGLVEGKEGQIIGKMFGVLVVKTINNEVGYLSAFSGKIGGGYHYPKLIPPVYDGLKAGSFLNNGMEELTRINQKIKSLEEAGYTDKEIEQLKVFRKEHSTALQERIFDQYRFLNIAGDEKSLRDIFRDVRDQKPPGGAGECALPKLLQYAFMHKMKPLAMAEFWWGKSPKSNYWKHKDYYPACNEKCEPILGHMLEGMEMDEKSL